MTDPAQLFAEAIAHHKAGQPEDAVRLYEQILTDEPDHQGALFNLAALHATAGRYDAARDLYTRALRGQPDDPDIHCNLGNLNLAKGDAAAAEACYRHALDAEPGHAAAHVNLGRLRLIQGRVEEALLSFRDALAIDDALVAAHSNAGVALSGLGQHDEARIAFENALRPDPANAETLDNLGSALVQLGRTDDAIQRYREAAEQAPTWARPPINLGALFEKLGRLEHAETSYRTALARDPADGDAIKALAAHLIATARHDEARGLLESHQAMHPDDAEGSFNLGNLYHAMKEPERAADHYRHALRLNPSVAEIHNNLATVLTDLGQIGEAIEVASQAIQLRPDFAHAHNTLGNAHAKAERKEEAARCFERAAALDPSLSVAAVNLANTLRDLGRLDEAKATLEGVIKREPELATASNALGLVLQDYGEHEAAIATFDKALAARPGYHEALNNRAISLQDLGRHDDALAIYRDALARNPDIAETHYNIGHVLQGLGRYDAAVAAFQQALALKPDFDAVYPFLAHALMYQCNWSNLEAVIAKVIDDAETRIAAGRDVAAPPFGLAATPASPALRLAVARQVSAKTAAHVRSIKRAMRFSHDRHEGGTLRVGYVSPDFREHSVAMVFRGLLDAHSREGFAWHGYSISPRQNLSFESFERAFDGFADLGHASLSEAAGRIHADGIDILIDLAGHTRDSRLELFALEPAPVQAHYLGYGSTLGADSIPYLITDPVHTPPALEAHISEAPVYLPDSFMVATPAEVAEATPERADCGLPAQGIVFANFNAHYKFHPRLFDVWMRLLKRIEGSVLWLREGTKTAEANLRNEADARGIDEGRLVFAPRVPRPEHLARHKLADLSLDALYHGGGVTTIDALWIGVPVVTLAGEAHSSRTGASLLTAIAMPELITDSLEAYAEIAFRLATEPAALQDIKDKLAANRLSEPLFQPERLARHLEAAYRLMWENFASGRGPMRITVPPVPI